jgi:hypothetical protein
MDPDPDADPDPAIFVIDLQDANKQNVVKKFFCLLLFEGTFTVHHFSKIKSPEEVTKLKESRFSYYFCLNDRRIQIRSRSRIHTST